MALTDPERIAALERDLADAHRQGLEMESNYLMERDKAESAEARIKELESILSGRTFYCATCNSKGKEGGL